MKFSIQFAILIMAMITLSVSDTFAQEISLKNGKETVQVKVNPNGNKTYTILGKDFKILLIRQKRGENLNYEVKCGEKLISSGRTANFSQIESDGQSIYYITIINKTHETRKVVLKFGTNSSGSGKKV